MKHSLFLLLCILSLPLAGCSLAMPDAPSSDVARADDVVIGMYLNISNRTATPYGDVEIHENGRTYATAVYTPYVTESGAEESMLRFVFPSAEGGGYFAQETPTGGTSLESSQNSTLISNPKYGVHLSDTEDANTVDGNLYLTPNAKGTLYITPIYQDGERIYFYPALDAATTALPLDASMAGHTEIFDHSYPRERDGEAITQRFTATIQVEVTNATNQLTLIQMRENDTEITRNHYTAEALPEQLDLPDDVAYLIAVSTKTTVDGNEVVEHEVLVPSAGNYDVYYEKENDYHPHTIKLGWAQES